MNQVGVLPSRQELLQSLELVCSVLQSESCIYRPRDCDGNPGGLLDFRTCQLPLVVVPDLHARCDFFTRILDFIPPVDFLSGLSIRQALEQEKVCVVCVGDGLHSEGRAKDRWRKAFDNYLAKDFCGAAMQEEMTEGLALMLSVMHVKTQWPRLFHFLKGNHENITNKDTGGDFSFFKYAYEGEMTTQFIDSYYGNDVLLQYAAFEHKLPLFMAYASCLISHAEPVTVFSAQQIIDYHHNPDVVYGLTWTANDDAQDGTVASMLSSFIPDVVCNHQPCYFAGHRPVSGTYSLRQDGLFIQIHNPSKQNIALVYPNRVFNPNTDILSVEN
ncbi:MAG: hypothetical protein K6E51_00185 [Treponema sp.]|nr:hypothetical protein [Treponema sp.]